jgi:hypothetical protein
MNSLVQSRIDRKVITTTVATTLKNLQPFSILPNFTSASL